jgi:hypothetical protein
MYNLIEYYEENGVVKSHLVSYCDTQEELDEVKKSILEEFKGTGVEILEVIASKNIQCLREILKRDDIAIFETIVD